MIHQLSPILGISEELVEMHAKDSLELRYGPDRESVINGKPNPAYESSGNGYVCPLWGEIMDLGIGLSVHTIADISEKYKTPCRIFDPLGRELVAYLPESDDRRRIRSVACSLIGGHAYFHDETVTYQALHPCKGTRSTGENPV